LGASTYEFAMAGDCSTMAAHFEVLSRKSAVQGGWIQVVNKEDMKREVEEAEENIKVAVEVVVMSVFVRPFVLKIEVKGYALLESIWKPGRVLVLGGRMKKGVYVACLS
jgi:hypothetical protein